MTAIEQIAGHGERLASEFAQRLAGARQFVFVPRKERNASALRRNLAGDGKAKPARAAGDEDNFAGE